MPLRGAAHGRVLGVRSAAPPGLLLIPMVLFPLMDAGLGQNVALLSQETNMMFVGGLVIARAWSVLQPAHEGGMQPRKLNFGLITVTMFVSMWISNTAATAMMIPIIRSHPERAGDAGDWRDKRPTKTTMCYFISTAYAASIGGMGCIVGSGTSLTFKGIYETRFPDSPGIEFAKWMMLNVPMMVLMMPNSQDAKRIRVGTQGEAAARKLIRQKIDEMGPMSFHEGAVAALFVLSVLLWFFRKPQFIVGWAELITEHKVKDATAALIVVLLLFMIPARPDFLYILSKDETKRPKTPSPALITWKVIQHKLPWGLIFLLGGGFALAEASKESKMSELIADHLHGMATLPKFAVMVISCVFATVLTQFSSNVAVANVLLPVLAEMSKVAKLHPLYLMLPTSLCCSFAYCLPVSTPPNAIAAAPCNMASTDMVKAGLGVAVISLLVLFAVFPFLAGAIWDLETYPSWVD
ncbi:hypothetical protein MTP99_006300 [Tenebrio molitor]|nr:hypothetical protein MTP99_006300 [Tenebrio molitor]